MPPARRSARGSRLILGPLLAGRGRGGQADRARRPSQCHRLFDGDRPRRRQYLSDGLSAAPGGGARGRLCPRARHRPFRRTRARHRLRASDGRRAARGGATDRRHGAKVEFFDPRAGDPSAAIGRLLPAAPPPDPAPSARPAAPPDQPAPPAGRRRCRAFDALLLPEGGSQLKQVGARARCGGARHQGDPAARQRLWDVPDIGSEPALDGGWFAASPPEARRDFERRFRATYGREPPRLASLGYDAAALAAVLARGEAGPPFSREAILNPNGFSGVDGLFRFTPQGLVQRGLAVLEVEPQGKRRRQPGAAKLQRSRLLRRRAAGSAIFPTRREKSRPNPSAPPAWSASEPRRAAAAGQVEPRAWRAAARLCSGPPPASIRVQSSAPGS